jgi:hypothetical protein
MFLLNSRGPLVTATYGPSLRQDHRHPLSRSYGADLPNSLTWSIPTRLRLLTQGTCVGSWYGRGESFLQPFSLTLGIG